MIAKKSADFAASFQDLSGTEVAKKSRVTRANFDYLADRSA